MVLEGEFLRVQYRFDPVGSGATPFEGHGYYRADTSNVWRGGWYDTQRAMHALSGYIDGDSLVAMWGAENAPHGRTIYRMLSSNKLEVTDSIRGKDGAWREFGRVLYSR
ncbi:MAG TPA: hypothetical protein VJW75_02660 [Candidatus Eisenbacteria bacterium]|nr:hypothetical protein [Candidatus Eisenbacteria bacterium]